MPRLFIISGCNGSGKTTASYTVLPELLECSEFVNSDEFAKSFSPTNPDGASIRAGRFMRMKIDRLFERRADFGIESTLATRSLLKLIKGAQEKGYTVFLLYLWLSSPEVALNRIRARIAAGGHAVEEETVRRRYYHGLSNLIRDYIPAVDTWMIADNTHPPFRMVAEGNRKGTTIIDPATYERIHDQIEEYLP